MTQGAAEDLWHLSIDDLFVTPVETPPLEGPGPFVINLSASTAPIGIPATGVSGFEKLKLYQLSRKEDGRDRFRLRLGFFDTPAAANEALAALRELYPSAFATNATEDDQRFNPARPRPPKGGARGGGGRTEFVRTRPRAQRSSQRFGSARQEEGRTARSRCTPSWHGDARSAPKQAGVA